MSLEKIDFNPQAEEKAAETIEMPIRIGDSIVLPDESGGKTVFKATTFFPNAGKILFTADSGETVERTPEQVETILSEQERLIQAASTLNQLYIAIETIKGLQGSKQFFPAQDLKAQISLVIEGKEKLNTITSAAGLRQKASEFLGRKIEKAKGDTASVFGFEKTENFAQFIEAIHGSGGIRSGNRFYPPQELSQFLELFRAGRIIAGYLPSAEKFRETAVRLKNEEALKDAI